MRHDKNYEANPAISQSDLKTFEENIVRFYNEKILGLQPDEVKTDYFDMGNMVDTILIEPDLKNEIYYVVSQWKASGKMKDVLDQIFKLCLVEYGNEWLKEVKEREDKVATFLEVSTEIMEHAIKALEWQNNWKMDTRISKLKELGTDYWHDIIQANGKHMIDLAVWNKAHEKATDILEDEFIGHELRALKDDHEEHLQVLRHLCLYGKYSNTDLKGELDFGIKDDKKMEIWPWDVKSAKSLARFKANYIKHRYGRQGAVYTELLRQNYPDYTIKEFQFLVIPTDTEEYPEKFTMTQSEIIAHTDGYESKNGYRIKGWRELVTDLEWHKEMSKWRHSKAYYMHGSNYLTNDMMVDPALVEEEVVF